MSHFNILANVSKIQASENGAVLLGIQEVMRSEVIESDVMRG